MRLRARRPRPRSREEAAAARLSLLTSPFQPDALFCKFPYLGLMLGQHLGLTLNLLGPTLLG